MTHDTYVYKTESEVSMEIMCSFPSGRYDLTHWKYVIQLCTNCPSLEIPSIESDSANYNIFPKIIFHVCRLVSLCTKYGKIGF